MKFFRSCQGTSLSSLNYIKSKRVYGTLMKNFGNDFDFLLSLINTTTPRLSNLSPEKWPQTEIKSKYVSSEVETSTATLGVKYRSTSNSVDGDENYLWASKRNDSNSKTDHGEVEVGDLSEQLGQLLESRLVSPPSKKDVKPLVKGIKQLQYQLWSYQPEKKTLIDIDDPNMTSTSRQTEFKGYAYIDEVKFVDLEKKSIVDILSKSFCFDIMDNQIEQKQLLFNPKSNSLKSLTNYEQSVEEPYQSLGGEGEEVKLVVRGIELKLLDHVLLCKLAKINGISVTGKRRSSLENDLCKYWRSIDEKEGEKLDIISILSPEDSPVTRFRLEKSIKQDAIMEKDEMEKGKSKWNAESESLFMKYTKEITECQRKINEMVLEYLTRNHPKCQISDKEVGRKENMLWNVISMKFPPTTPRQCKQQWTILYRLEEERRKMTSTDNNKSKKTSKKLIDRS